MESVLTDTRAGTDLLVAEVLLVLCHGVDTTHKRTVETWNEYDQAHEKDRSTHIERTVRDRVHEPDETDEVECDGAPAEGVEVRVSDGLAQLGVEDGLLDLRVLETAGWTHDAGLVLRIVVAVLAYGARRHCCDVCWVSLCRRARSQERRVAGDWGRLEKQDPKRRKPEAGERAGASLRDPASLYTAANCTE